MTQVERISSVSVGFEGVLVIRCASAITMTLGLNPVWIVPNG